MDKVATFIVNLVQAGRAPGIVFARTKARAHALAEEIGAGLGLRVPVVTSEMSKPERSRIANSMRAGSDITPVVVATAAWSTGVDIPGLKWVAFADRGKAPIGTTQSAGRAARVADGKAGYEVFEFCEESASARGSHLAGYCADEAFVQSLSLPSRPAQCEGRSAMRSAQSVQREQVALRAQHYQAQGRKLMWGFFVGGGILMSLIFG